MKPAREWCPPLSRIGSISFARFERGDCWRLGNAGAQNSNVGLVDCQPYYVGEWGADDVIVRPETSELAVIGTDGYLRIDYRSNEEFINCCSRGFSEREAYGHWKNRIRRCFRSPKWTSYYVPFWRHSDAWRNQSIIVVTERGDVAFTLGGEVWLAKQIKVPVKSDIEASELFHFSNEGLLQMFETN